MEDAFKFIIRRHINAGAKYLEIFYCDDKKLKPERKSKFFEFGYFEPSDLEEYISKVNVNNMASYFNINPLSKNRRIKDNIIKYVYAFIDLDDGATEEHKTLIEQYLLSKGFEIEYIAKSGGGYHFLIPIDLECKRQSTITNFLNYLKINVCDKVDVRTNDPSRITRVPSSWHYKKEPFQLQTLHAVYQSEDNIKKNTELLNDFQEENKINSKETIYTKNIERKDIFFSKLLGDQDNWNEIYSMLNEHDKKGDGKGTNKIFNKNLAIFCFKNPDYIDITKSFFKRWNNSWVTLDRFEHYLSKVSNTILEKENNSENQVNYFELLKWIKEYNLTLFLPLLEEQLRTSFLDKFEIYYLDEEKNDSQYLMYFVDKGFYVEKNMNNLIESIYHESSLYNIDLVKELNVKKTKTIRSKNSDGTINTQEQKLSFYEIYKNLIHKIKSLLLKENRIQKLDNISYMPLDQKILKENGKTYFNVYQKPSILDQEIKNVDKNSFKRIKELILNLTNNDEKYYEWFINWLSFIIQNPDKKLPTAVIFQGQQGTGKGVFKNLILDNLFGKNIQEINQTHLESSFNQYLMGKQIIVANEVIHNENKALLPNVLKNIITDPTITINRKFKTELVIKNYTHWIFCTNNDNPLKIDKDDRRYSVFYSERLKGCEKEAYKFVIDLQQNLDYEMNNFYSYLMNYDSNEAIARDPIMSQAKKEIIELNKDSSERFIEYCNQFKNLFELWISLFEKGEVPIIEDQGQKYILTDKVYLLYEEYCELFKEKGRFAKQNFSKRMSSLNLKSSPKRIDSRVYRVYKEEDLKEVLFLK